MSRTATLLDAEMPMSAILPSTRYFEIESRHVGGRFAIWVTTPPLYDREPDRHYPAIYVPDGNSTAPTFAPRVALLRSDPINPIEPFVLVCIGYTGVDANRMLAARARDLLPPGEPLPEGLDEGIKATVTMGLLDPEGAALYLHNLRNPAADKFQAFLTEELHPVLAAKYRLSDQAGLFGYSYGGLFAAHVAMTRSPLFYRIGAGSPGILPKVSQVLAAYEKERAADADHSGRMLHVTYCERELTVRSNYQPYVALGSTELIAMAGQTPLQGLAFSSQIVPLESHATGSGASFWSYLRTCYPASAPG